MKSWKDNITFVLVEPRESGNIGAAARAIKNMGFRNLSLVKPPAVITEEARWLARNALDILASAETHGDLREATADKALVAGTTRRTGRRRGLILQAEAGARRICEAARGNKVAILFGREDRGLYNEEVEGCGFLMTIPTGREHGSLNLAQSVLIIAYELLRAGSAANQAPRHQARFIGQEELRLLYARVGEVLKDLGYIRRGSRDLEGKIMKNLKCFIGRAGITDWELKMLHGILTQIERKLGKDEEAVKYGEE